MEPEPGGDDDDGQESSPIFTYVILCLCYCYRCNSPVGGISGPIEFSCKCIGRSKQVSLEKMMQPYKECNYQ
jgi:hypothetical protein